MNVTVCNEDTGYIDTVCTDRREEILLSCPEFFFR